MTGLEIFLTELSRVEGRPESRTLAAVSAAELISVRHGEAFLMVVELDHGESGAALDLRPEIPVRIIW